MFDFISIGDSTIDNFVQIHDAEIKCNLDKSNCMLCVDYGDKIAVDKLVHSIGGNAANSAVGSARLNLKSAIYTNIGSDLPGKQILERFKSEGISSKYVVVGKDLESNLSTILNFQGERTIFVYHQSWDYKLPDMDSSKWVYFTSLGATFTQSNLVNELIRYLERTSSRMLYSPGTHQIKSGIKKNPKLLALTRIFIVNLDESKRILGYKDDENIPIRKLLKELADLGPKMVVITDGAKGSFGFDGEQFYHIGVFPSKLVEMTGAGDAYATGLLAGLFYGKDLKEAMSWGAANGAAVTEQIGSQAGLLTYDQMQKKLKDSADIKSETF